MRHRAPTMFCGSLQPADTLLASVRNFVLADDGYCETRRTHDADPPQLGWSHAGRVGAARGDLDRLAAPRATTGPASSRAIPWVYAEIVRHLHTGEKVRILVNDAAAEKRRRGMLDAGRRRPEPGRLLPHSHRPRLDARLRPDLRHDRRRRARPAPTGASTPGPSTPTGSTTTPCPTSSPSRCGCRTWQPAVQAAGASSSKAAASTSTARAAADHRGMPAQPRAGAQSRPDARPTSSRSSPTTSACDKVLWLGRGIAGDDTHGHVDDLARFVDPRTVVTVVEDDPADANYEPLQENLRPPARHDRPATGKPLEVVTLPMPAPADLRRPAAAGQLRQLLHRQRPGAGADVQRPATTASPWASSPSCFPAARWSASTPSIWSGAWARCTA